MPMHKTVVEDAYRGNKLYVPGKYTYTQRTPSLRRQFPDIATARKT